MDKDKEAFIALNEIIKLIKDNILVRNIKDDDNFVKFFEQGVRISKVLKYAHEVLGKENMSKINWEFIKAKDARLIEKEPEYGGENNPKNYKNMALLDLWNRLEETYDKLKKLSMEEKPSFKETKKKLVDLSNFCGFLWEKLEQY